MWGRADGRGRLWPFSPFSNPLALSEILILTYPQVWARMSNR